MATEFSEWSAWLQQQTDLQEPLVLGQWQRVVTEEDEWEIVERR